MKYFKKLIHWIMKPDVPDINVMIEVLLDPTAEEGERHDVAMDLRDYPIKKVEKALVQAAKDKSDDDVFLDSCGQSLGVIWTKKGKLDVKSLLLLAPSAYDSALVVIKEMHPEWITEYNLKG